MVIHRRAGGLDDEHVAAAHVLANLHFRFAVRETPDFRVAQRNAQISANIRGQLGVGVAGKNAQILGELEVTCSRSSS